VVSRFLGLCGVMVLWFREVVFEVKDGSHGEYTKRGVMVGVVLFIFREVMFFFTFF